MQWLNKKMDEWWEERFASGDVDIKREADRGIGGFAGDAEFSRLFTELYMRNVLYQRGIDLAGRRRRLIREEGQAIARARPSPGPQAFVRPTRVLPPSPIDDEPARPEPPSSGAAVQPAPVAAGFAEAAPVLGAQVTRSWDGWLERDPDTGHHTAIDSFTKPKLLAASRKNRDRGGRYLYNAALYALFAGRLTDDQSSLGDVLDDHQKNLIAGNLQVRLRAEFGLRGIPGRASWEELLT